MELLPRQRFDLLVFDWDGTLMDSTATISQSIQAAFCDIGLEAPSRRDCNYVIGFGLKEAMQYLAPNLPDAEVQKLVERYRHHFLNDEHQLALFEGVLEAMPRLRDAGYSMAVATGKARAGLDRMLSITGLGAYFEVTRCADEAFSKPHPAMLEYILDYTCTAPQRALMIGDTTHDLQLAINAKTHSVAMSYGAHPLDELLPLNPVTHFDDFTDLANWLLGVSPR